MAALGADDRIFPDLPVIGQSPDVFGRLLLVLTILEQPASGRPEYCRAVAVGELRQQAEMQRLRIVPVRGHAQRGAEVFEVEANALGPEGDLVRRSVDAGVGDAFEKDVGIRQRWDNYIPKDVIDDILPSIREECTVDGKLYSWPFLLDVIGSSWHSGLTAKAGLPDAAPATWDEFLAGAKKIVDSKVAPWGATFGRRAWSRKMYSCSFRPDIRCLPVVPSLLPS
jgi:hypothetical protein